MLFIASNALPKFALRKWMVWSEAVLAQFPLVDFRSTLFQRHIFKLIASEYWMCLVATFAHDGLMMHVLLVILLRTITLRMLSRLAVRFGLVGLALLTSFCVPGAPKMHLLPQL